MRLWTFESHEASLVVESQEIGAYSRFLHIFHAARYAILRKNE